MKGSPNPALQRTPPASPLAPLSFETLGEGAMRGYEVSRAKLGAIAIVVVLSALSSSRLGAQTFTEFEIPTSNSRPLCITSGPDGNLWFTELEGNRLGRITPAGVITEFPLPTPNSLPSGITSAHGSIWLVESQGNKVARVLTDGTIHEFPIRKRRFSPTAITIGSDGNLWIAGAGGVGRVDRSGSVVVFEIPDSQEVRGIAPGPANTVWVTDSRAGQVRNITFSGKLKKKVSGYQPDQIAAGADGDVWFTMVDGDGIARISPAGEVEVFQLPHSAPAALVADRTGTVWVSDWIWNTIIRVTPSGGVSRYSVPTPKGSPAGITLGPDGNVWFVEGIASKVGRLVLNPSAR